ncbi:MAG TPA: CHRD domain-containing protein [Verrucomicrobiae bacterium]|nr:CHRD domain-containing protein [Verrucomicrobiae bacterium]
MKKLILSLGMASCLVSAQAAVYIFDATLTGANESPANASPAFGYAVFQYDDAAHSLTVQALFAGLIGTTTAAHVHAPTALPFQGTASVATTVPNFAGFPTGVTLGLYNNTLDLTAASSYNPAFVTANGGTTAGAEAALVAAMFAGRSYLNIHTTQFPGGEIRGFLTLVPEPSSFALLTLGGAALMGVRARRRA